MNWIKKLKKNLLKKEIKEIEEKNKKILGYLNSIAWATRDYIHYIGIDISENEINISKNNGLIVSLVGKYYPKQYERDINKLYDKYIKEISTEDIIYREFKQNGIEELLSIPSKYWIDFCIKLLDTDNKKESLIFIKEIYKLDKKNDKRVKSLPIYKEDL